MALGCPKYPYILKGYTPDFTYHAFKRYVYYRQGEDQMNLGTKYLSDMQIWYAEAQKREQEILSSDKVEEFTGMEFVEDEAASAAVLSN